MRRKKKERLKEEKFWGNFYHFYAKLPPGLEAIPAHIRKVNFRCSDISDEDLLRMTTEVRSIELLDMDDTEITNEGIRHLTRLDHITELRLKECQSIDNGCLEHLGKIPGLTLLHLGGTGVTIDDDLLQLTPLKHLKTLLLSSDDTLEVVKEKLRKLAVALPDCQFLVNHKEVEMS